MLSSNFLSFLIIEICISFTVLFSFFRVFDEANKAQFIAPLIIHYCVFIFKVLIYFRSNMKGTTIYLNLQIGFLLCQSLEVGIMAQSSRSSICYLQGLIFIQYIIMLEYNDLYKPSILGLICFSITQVYINYDILFDLLEILIQSIITINLVYYLIQQNGKKESRKIEEITKIQVFEEHLVQSNVSTVKHKVLQMMPFLTDQHFLVINDQMAIVHDQLNLLSFIDHQIEVDIDEFEREQLNYLLEIKCECLSSNLQQMLVIQEKEQTLKRVSTKYEFGVLLKIILENVDSYYKFLTVYELESKMLKLNNIKINIFLINDQEGDEELVIIHFEQHLEKRQQYTKSLGTYTNVQQNGSTFTQNKTIDSISSSLFSNIFKSISHEFGTYLNCILTVSQEATTSQTIEIDLKSTYFEPIYINAKLLNYILQNIRDFNLILLGQFAIRLQEFKPIDILLEIKYLLSYQCLSRNNQITISCSIDMVIYSDAERFKQVLYQLLSNSMRFTQDGKIYVEITTHNSKIKVSVHDEGIGMNIQEQNKLNGMLKDSKKMLKVSSNSVGCGLGLSISNEIVKKMNGNNKGINFTSQEHKGSTFFFLINSDSQLYNESVYAPSQTCIKVLNDTYYMEKQSSEFSQPRNSISQRFFQNDSDSVQERSNMKKSKTIRKESSDSNHQFLQRYTENSCINSRACPISEDSPNQLEQSLIVIPSLETNFKTKILQFKLSSICCKRVLIVDDEFFNILSLQLILKRFKVEADFAFNGKQALEKCHFKMLNPCKNCQNSGYIVYFLDLNMPVMDGFSTVRQLKQMMTDKELPRGICIANTGFSDIESKQKAEQSGMDKYLTKPININELERYLRDKFPNSL